MAARANGSRRQRQYSDEEKEAVVRDAPQLGVIAAARKHGVPKSTASQWCQRARACEGASQGREAKASATAVFGGEGMAMGRVRKRRIAKSYTPSEKAEAVEYAAEHGVTAASEQLGISRFSIDGWRKQVEKAAAGTGSSPTSGPAPSELEAQRDKEILDEWHRHPGLGPSQIKNQLRRRSVKVSVHTVRRVMEDAGYRPPKVKRQPHDERFDAVRPNHMWHLDFVHRHINRASTFTLIVIDDHSR